MLDKLWFIAFGPRPSWRRPLRLLIWALFGNGNEGDNGGPYGWLPRDTSKPDPNWPATIRWWLRNPAHNLTHYLMAIPFERQRLLIGKPKDGTLPTITPAGHILLAWNGGPFFKLQFTHWEAYAGFRPKVVDGRRVGIFGLALRGRR
ncbi:hypothetical protein [Thioclava sp. F36-6]|uniref:hypothetical protein n=1 Tax=Thioclava sp. F36-6 TaxID=1915316 RepID=UPI000997B91C|nr:hypothetical protein [Thioclava sp. F36-6]OOY31575.1 hypothetical protein BMI88_10865 [Thioclava sp. F36-6]